MYKANRAFKQVVSFNLNKTSILLKYPIIICGQDYLQIKTASAFKQYFEPNSKGIKKLRLDKQFTDENLS